MSHAMLQGKRVCWQSCSSRQLAQCQGAMAVLMLIDTGQCQWGTAVRDQTSIHIMPFIMDMVYKLSIVNGILPHLSLEVQHLKTRWVSLQLHTIEGLICFAKITIFMENRSRKRKQELTLLHYRPVNTLKCEFVLHFCKRNRLCFRKSTLRRLDWLLIQELSTKEEHVRQRPGEGL